MKKFTSQKIKEFVSKPLFDEKIIFKKDPSYLKISIVTPSYNQAKFLERTILSVLNQNYPNLEYIIIDGGSKDGSVEIIKRYEKFLSYWISEPDKGQADAIKKGFDKSTGEIIAYINSDDTYLPRSFFKMAEASQKHFEADLIFGDIYFINEYDQIIGECKLTNLNITHLVYEGICLTQQATFWTKEIYNKVGGLNPKYKFCMDFDLFTRIADMGQLNYIPGHIANFRIHKDSKTSTNLDIWSVEHDEIVRQYLPQNINRTYFICRKNLCRIQRILYYLIQGDIKYILKKCANRLRGITFWEELNNERQS